MSLGELAIVIAALLSILSCENISRHTINCQIAFQKGFGQISVHTGIHAIFQPNGVSRFKIVCDKHAGLFQGFPHRIENEPAVNC